jgi:hypothetical protein
MSDPGLLIATKGDMSLYGAFLTEERKPLKAGFHSQVDLVEFSGKKFVDKATHRRIPFEGEEGYKEAAAIMPAILTYAKRLSRQGDRVTLPLLSAIFSDAPGKYYIRSLEHYQSRDREVQLESEVGGEHYPSLALELGALDGMICHTGTPIYEFTLGVDFKLANRTSNGFYVDKYPVRMEVNGVLRVEDPQPITSRDYRLAYWRSFTAQGVLTVLLTDGIRIRPDCCEQFIEEVRRFVRPYSELQEYVQANLGIQFAQLETANRKEILEYLSCGEDPYAIRMCALILQSECRKAGKPEDWVPTIWEQTRYRKDESQQACNTLLKVLDRLS